jgi:hypothetical protein
MIDESMRTLRGKEKIME